MSHVRTQLRTALQSALTGLPTTGSRVAINRSAPVAAAQTPCLLITTPGEEVEMLDAAGQYVRRRIAVQVEAVASGTTLDDQLDQMAAEVEAAIFSLRAAFPQSKSIEYQGMQMERDDTSSPPMGSLRMLYQIQVITLATDPETAL